MITKALLRAMLLLFATGCASAARMNVSEIDALMRDYDRPEGPGASVIIVRHGKVLFRESYGTADLEQRTAASSATHYRLASVTKQFTAAAILVLSDQKKLSLGDSVRSYLPSLPASADAVTIGHLLTHTSGLIDYEDVIPNEMTAQLKDRDVLTLLEGQTSTYFSPGTSYRYSNSGYALLALIVERVSRQSFAEFLRGNIFLPHGMTTTVAHEDGISTVVNRAYGYSREGEGWQRTDQSRTSAVLGDGGIYSSVDDLSHWLRALDKGLFRDASIARVGTDRPGVRYGYGWRVGEHGGKRIVWHTGESIGFRNALVRFPDQGLAVVVLTNRNEGEPRKIALALADHVLR